MASTCRWVCEWVPVRGCCTLGMFGYFLLGNFNRKKLLDPVWTHRLFELDFDPLLKEGKGNKFRSNPHALSCSAGRVNHGNRSCMVSSECSSSQRKHWWEGLCGGRYRALRLKYVRTRYPWTQREITKTFMPSVFKSTNHRHNKKKSFCLWKKVQGAEFLKTHNAKVIVFFQHI